MSDILTSAILATWDDYIEYPPLEFHVSIQHPKHWLKRRQGRYRYRSLNHPKAVRILVLSPAPDYYSELCCHLRIQSLDQRGAEFDAVSYAWGEASDTSHIFVDETIFNIKPTLATALRRLRSTRTERHL